MRGRQTRYTACTIVQLKCLPCRCSSDTLPHAGAEPAGPLQSPQLWQPGERTLAITAQQTAHACIFVCAAGQHNGVAPTTWQREVANKSNQVKVFVYDLAGAGFQPPLSDFAADGPACDCPPIEQIVTVSVPGVPQDICVSPLQSRTWRFPACACRATALMRTHMLVHKTHTL